MKLNRAVKFILPGVLLKTEEEHGCEVFNDLTT